MVENTTELSRHRRHLRLFYARFLEVPDMADLSEGSSFVGE